MSTIADRDSRPYPKRDGVGGLLWRANSEISAVGGCRLWTGASADGAAVSLFRNHAALSSLLCAMRPVNDLPSATPQAGCPERAGGLV